MKTSCPPPPGRRRGGFTLIELLTVVAIIGVLAAASVGAYGKIMDMVKKKDTEVMAQNIANAVEQFYTEYTRLPRPESSGGQATDVEVETSHTDGIIMVLIAQEGEAENKQNTKDIDFLAGFKQAKANPKKNSAQQDTEGGGGVASEWINGLVFEEGKYEVVDPWGNYFKIKLDLDMDGILDNPNTDEGAATRTKLRKQVILWSPGKDMDPDKWEDNVKSWQ